MDFEAPADAWYVYVAVVIVSVAFAGIALGLVSMPPPDAQQAANTIEGAAGSDYQASASYEHDADVVTITHRTITMENEHGTAHASFSYGSVVPVNGNERLENVTYGRSFEDEFADELDDPHTDATAEFFELVDDADARNTGEELHADGEIVARRVPVREDSTVGLEARATNNDDLAADLADEADDVDEDDVEIPGEIRLRVHGTADDTTTVRVDGTPVTETVSVDDSDGWFVDTVTGFTCGVLGWWCDDVPDVDPIDETSRTFSRLEEGDGETITLVEGDLEELTDSDADEVDIWAGSYDVRVEATGADFEDCEGTIDREREWSGLCGPDLTLDDFDDPHWHDDRGGVHYVTLVMV